MLLTDLKRNAYEQYKAKWLESHHNLIDEDGEEFVCYDEFLDNEFQSEELMKYYLSEDLFNEYKKASRFSPSDKLEEMKKLYSYMVSIQPTYFYKKDYDCFYTIYQDMRYKEMKENIFDYLVDGAVFENGREENPFIAKLQDKLVDDIICSFEHMDIEGAAKVILNYFCELNEPEFCKSNEYIEMSENVYGFARVMFENCYITSYPEYVEDEED